LSALATTQREFIDALYSQTPCDAGVEVYRRNMLANLGGALATTFPVVKRLVGDAFFAEAARQFVPGHPSRSGDLNDYGEAFPAFLERYPHAQSLPYLADVARLEWACHESYLSADAAAFDLAALAAVAPDSYPRIRFALHPAVRLVRSRYPVAAIWNANLPGLDGTPDRVEGSDSVLVKRDGATIRVDAIDAAQWDFLAALVRGATLEEASAAAGEDFAERLLATGLARLVADGIVTGFSIAEEEA